MEFLIHVGIKKCAAFLEYIVLRATSTQRGSPYKIRPNLLDIGVLMIMDISWLHESTSFTGDSASQILKQANSPFDMSI